MSVWKAAYQRSLLSTQCPGIFTGAGYVGTSFVTYQNSRRPEGKQVFCINHIVCVVQGQQISLSGSWECSWDLGSQVPSRGPASIARLPEGSSLGPALLTLFCTALMPKELLFPLLLFQWLHHINRINSLKEDCYVRDTNAFAIFIDMPYCLLWSYYYSRADLFKQPGGNSL